VVNAGSLTVAPMVRCCGAIIWRSHCPRTWDDSPVYCYWTWLGGGGIGVAWGTARSLVRPINQLATSVHAISGGDLSQPVPQLGKDEIGELGQSFDSMREALKKSLEEIQEWNRVLKLRWMIEHASSKSLIVK